jgi:hypothetical protein
MADEYRDALGAAQRRIEQLEGELAVARADKAARTPPKRSAKWVALAAAGAFVMLAATAAGAWFYVHARARHTPDAVSVTAMQSNGGWLVTFHLPQDASDVSYRVLGEREWNDLGTMPWGVGANGKSMPLLTTTIPFEQVKEPTVIELRYKRDNGTHIGPVRLSFSPTKQDVESTKAILNMVGQWVAINPDRDGAIIYFTTLLSYRHALTTIEYGIDSEEPTTRFEFTPTDRSEIDPNDPLYVRTGRVPKFVSVRLTYKDGTKSALKKFYPSSLGRSGALDTSH